MTRALFRDTMRAIRKTLSRFISIVIIVALGVGFFAGLKAVSPNMKAAAQTFYRRHNLADIAVVSTVGFDSQDLANVLTLPGVESATLSRSIDGILMKPDGSMEQSMSGTAYVLRIIGYDFTHAVGSESRRLNQLELVEYRENGELKKMGRWPQPGNPYECVVSAYENTNEPQHYALGQKIRVQGDHEDLLDTVRSEYYTVVGVVYTPEFVSMELGASQAGGGELSGYIYINDSAFVEEDYFTMYIGVAGAKGEAAYTDAYAEAVRAVKEELEASAQAIYTQRVERVDYFRRIEEGRRELAEGYENRETLRKAVAEGPELMRKGREQGERELAAGQAEYDKGLADYQKGMDEYLKNKAIYDEAKVEVDKHPNAMIEYENAKSMIERAKNSYEVANTLVQAGRSAIRVANSALASGDPERITNAMGILSKYLPLTEADMTIEGLQARIDEAQAQLAEQEEALAEGRADLEDAERQLREAETQIAQLKEFQKLEQGLLQGKKELDDAFRKLQGTPAQLEAGRARLEAEMLKAEQEYASAKSLLLLVESEVANGERKIRRYENKEAAMSNPQWIISDRDEFPGYTNYGDTSDNMEQFALIFPALFFLVAMLMTLTTMTRMVGDERTQLGVLKAAGYSTPAIAFKYLFYAFTAGLLGCVLGLALGFTLIPVAIFTAYKILYLIPTMQPGFFPLTAAQAFAATLVATVVTTIIAVMWTLRSRPAQLMRPKAPKAGKRVFLEWFPFIWRRLGFNGKVTVRNLMRNKVRFMMTFVGIMSCTALLLTGFGIGNSVGSMLAKQFGPESIMKFDAQALLQAPMKAGDPQVLQMFSEQSQGRIANILPVYMKKMYAGAPGASHQIDVTIAVPENRNAIPDFIAVNDEKTGEALPLTDDGVIIGGKTAELYGLGVGDLITIQSGAMKADIPIAGVVRNHVYHYIYMSPTVFEQYFGVEETTYNMVMLKLDPALTKFTGSDKAVNEVKEARTALALDLSDTAEVITVVYNKTIVDSVDKMLQIMKNVIVSVFTIAAGALAFVVLYNLNNINIYERIRELATIKVLGFYDKEADMFIYRENIIITILGIAAGLALGIPIHRFVIVSAEIESMMFVRTLAPNNFIAAAAITAIFAILINLLMHKKIKDISMVESLKSVE